LVWSSHYWYPFVLNPVPGVASFYAFELPNSASYIRRFRQTTKAATAKLGTINLNGRQETCIIERSLFKRRVLETNLAMKDRPTEIRELHKCCARKTYVTVKNEPGKSTTGMVKPIFGRRYFPVNVPDGYPVSEKSTLEKSTTPASSYDSAFQSSFPHSANAIASSWFIQHSFNQ
jgi:hypothetical protein